MSVPGREIVARDRSRKLGTGIAEAREFGIPG